MSLVDTNGETVIHHEDLSRVAISYFHNTLGTFVEVMDFPEDISLPAISGTQFGILLASFTQEVVFKTLKKITKNRSLGPD